MTTVRTLGKALADLQRVLGIDPPLTGHDAQCMGVLLIDEATKRLSAETSDVLRSTLERIAAGHFTESGAEEIAKAALRTVERDALKASVCGICHQPIPTAPHQPWCSANEGSQP